MKKIFVFVTAVSLLVISCSSTNPTLEEKSTNRKITKTETNIYKDCEMETLRGNSECTGEVPACCAPDGIDLKISSDKKYDNWHLKNDTWYPRDPLTKNGNLEFTNMTHERNHVRVSMVVENPNSNLCMYLGDSYFINQNPLVGNFQYSIAGELVCFDTLKSKEKWRFPALFDEWVRPEGDYSNAGGYYISWSNPVFYKNSIYALNFTTRDIQPAFDGYLICVDAQSGELIWKRKVLCKDDYITIADGKVFVGSSEFDEPTSNGMSRAFCCFDASDGKLIWKTGFTSKTNNSSTNPFWNSLYCNGKVYVLLSQNVKKYCWGAPESSIFAVIDKDSGKILFQKEFEKTSDGIALGYGKIFLALQDKIVCFESNVK